MERSYWKQCLVESINKYALERSSEGDLSRSKDSQSKYHLDCRNMILSPQGLYNTVYAIESELRGIEFDAIGGPTVGADPIVGGFIMMKGLTELNLITPTVRGFLVRKDGKKSKKGRIVGDLKKGDRCVIIKDVVSTGASTIDAINVVENFGAKVIRIISVIDRLTGGSELFAKHGIQYSHLVTIEELGLSG